MPQGQWQIWQFHFNVRPSPLTLFTIMIYRFWHLGVALLYDLADNNLAYHSRSSSHWTFTHMLWRVLRENLIIFFVPSTWINTQKNTNFLNFLRQFNLFQYSFWQIIIYSISGLFLAVWVIIVLIKLSALWWSWRGLRSNISSVRLNKELNNSGCSFFIVTP